MQLTNRTINALILYKNNIKPIDGPKYINDINSVNPL